MFLSVFVCVHNPNNIYFKSLSACISRFLLVHLKCEHLTSRPDVESFMDRGVCVADLQLVTGQCDSPLGAYHGQSHACW